MIYLPKQGSDLPALVIELKWNKSAQGAIDQIKSRGYIDAIKDYGGKILLVGINYDKNAGKDKKHHTCKIEEVKI